MSEPNAPGPELEPQGFFALRTPLLPFDGFLAWGQEREPAALRARLRAWLEPAFVREALFLASPSLEESLPFWLREPESERGQKVEATLVKYFTRMSGRATPFGLFSGCSIGALGEATRLELEPRASARRHTRLDDDYLTGLAEELVKDPALRPSLGFRPNSSLYRAAGRIRFAAGRQAADGRSYQLVALEPTPYLDAALEAARDGARPGEIAARVQAAAGPDVSLAEAEEFVAELVSAQALRSDLEPLVTGREPVHDLIEQLAPIEAARPAVAKLESVRAALEAIDASGLGTEPARYRELARELEALPAKVELPRLFQVDLVKPAPRAVLGEAVVSELRRAVGVLHSLAGPNDGGELAQFRDAFSARYEERTVPLVEALDEESGLGFAKSNAPAADASPLLRGLAFPARGGAAERWETRHAWLLEKLEGEAVRRGGALELSAKDLDELKATRPGEAAPLPDALFVMATLAAASDEAIARGDWRVFIESAGGPSGAQLLGRFCHGDPELHRLVERHLRAEEALRPEAVFAEIVHLPEGRLGNVILRPVLRSHEIPFLGRSGAPRERQLPITDLEVAVRDGRVVLTSRRLGKEVVPRLTSALNVQHRSSQGVHKFLAALQHQGVTPGVGWSWGPLESATFLPRVISGRSVLALARWRLPIARLKEELGKKASFDRGQVARWRERFGLPRLVALQDGDNVLPVDLENALSVETFLGLVKDRPAAVVRELFPGPEELCARSPEGRFPHELVVPFVRRAPAPRAATRGPATPATARAERVFLPGSEWLYAKLYTGTGTADQVLREVIAPVLERARASGAAQGWFFLRFGDPDWHVRFRIRGEPGRLTSEVLPDLAARAGPLVADGRLQKLVLDSYEREVERYGGPEGMRLAERIFEVDSDAVLAIVQLLAGDSGADARWRLTLRGIDALLADLGLDLAAKRALMTELRDGYGREHGADDGFWRQLGQKLRKDRAGVESLLDPAKDEASPLAPGFAILRARSERLAPIAAELAALEARGGLGQPRARLAASLVHMHANRLLRSAQRAQECVLYYDLDRLYESQAARARRA